MKELHNMLSMQPFQQKMRDEYLSFQKYNLKDNIIHFGIYPLIYAYKVNLNRYGAYDLSLEGIIKKINILDKDTALFCKAEILFLKGKFSQSIEILNELKNKYNKKTEIYYLLHKNYIMINEILKAQNTLYELLQYSIRKKTWLYLANSIENMQQFKIFEKIFLQYINVETERNIQIFNYYSEAALRAEQYNKALNIWIKFIKNIKKVQYGSKQIKKIFDNQKAEKALLDLKTIMDGNQVPFFLVSGTLLGCIREGRILPHDKDLDIGVFDKDWDQKYLKKILTRSGFFEILPTRIFEQIKVKHNNGTYIDIFLHSKEQDYTWHYASKIKWFNSNFNLKEYSFLNKKFLIPDNTKKYLIENYGEDWETPKVNFDSNFDTPNSKIVNMEEMQIFYVRMLAYKYLNNDIESVSFKRLVKNLSHEVIICLKKELILVE